MLLELKEIKLSDLFGLVPWPAVVSSVLLTIIFK